MSELKKLRKKVVALVLVTGFLVLLPIFPAFDCVCVSYSHAFYQVIVDGIATAAGDFVSYILIALAQLVLAIANSFLLFAGIVVNFTVNEAFKFFVKVVENPIFLDLWGAIRDIVNFIIIASLIAVGISTIVRYEKFNAKSTLVQVLVVAVFVNFSLLFATLIMDVSGTIANAFSNQISKDAADTTTTFSINIGSSLSNSDQGLGLSIIKASGVTRIYTSARGFKAVAIEGTSFDTIKGDIYFIIGSIFYFIVALVLIWVMFEIALIILKTIVSMMLIALFSPLGFIPRNIPKIGEWAKMWWQKLWCVVLILPTIFLLLLLFTRISAVIPKARDQNLPEFNLIAQDLFFLIVVVLLLRFIVIAVKKMNAKCAEEFGGENYLSIGRGVAKVSAAGVAAGTTLAGVGRARRIARVVAKRKIPQKIRKVRDAVVRPFRKQDDSRPGPVPKDSEPPAAPGSSSQPPKPKKGGPSPVEGNQQQQ